VITVSGGVLMWWEFLACLLHHYTKEKVVSGLLVEGNSKQAVGVCGWVKSEFRILSMIWKLGFLGAKSGSWGVLERSRGLGNV